MDNSLTAASLESIFSRLRTPGSEKNLDRPKPSIEEIKHDLEKTFLIPQQSFPSDWLNKCQEHWDEKVDYIENTFSQVSKPMTAISVARKGYDGNVVGFKETILEDATLTSNNSTSFTRAFGSTKDFVRGSAAQFPFAPGGLDVEIEVDLDNKVDLNVDLEFDNVNGVSAPGLDRGLSIEGEDEAEEEEKGDEKQVQETKKDSFILDMQDMMRPVDNNTFDFLNVKPLPIDEEREEEKAKAQEVTESKSSEDIDELLPTNIAPQKDLSKKSVSTNEALKRREWAHEINVNEPFDNFYDLVPEMAMQFPFELDVFQKRAVYHLEKGESVFIAAHTSAGKTVVADYAIALATKHMTKAIYTSPIKALSNQKFRDFKHTFGDDVGILTGDVQIKPEASCLVMTTEILRSMLYRGADLIRDVEFVIFDEVHYVNDLERGVVWEEVIIMLPAHVNIILLSATVPNTREFAGWVGRTKKKDIYVISTLKRPVPLEHYLYANKEIYKIVGANENKLSTVGYRKAQDAMSKRKKEVEKSSGRGGRGGSRGGSVKPVGRSYQAVMQTDRNLFVHLIGMLKLKSLLPVVIFTFSKRRCEEYASGLTKTDLCTSIEKSEIHVFIERSLVRLRGTDKLLPQILRMRDLLSRGIAVHHGGLLPIIKEMVEILFARGLVKVLFATETFAMGVNMPARCVVFSGIRKHDGRSFRDLLPGEYTQMSGRAGRRGLDSTGVVIIATGGDEPPEAGTLSTMLLGKPTKLESQFRLTYNMILNLLRVEALKVEEMIKRSFSENTSQKLLPETKQLMDENEQKRKDLRQLTCAICEPDLERFYDLCSEVIILTRNMMTNYITTTPSGNRALTSGRVVIINTNVYRNTPAVLLKALPTNANNSLKSYSCLVLSSSNEASQFAGSEETPPLPITTLSAPGNNDIKSEILTISATDILFVTKVGLKVDAEVILAGDNSPELIKLSQALESFTMDAQKTGVIEYDWGKIKDMEFQEMLRTKTDLMKRLRSEFQCVKCPDLNEHFALVHDHKRISNQIDLLKMSISDQNLELLPDYHQRIDVLRQLNYIDDQGSVQLKGRVACEINTADELLLTELVLDNVFADFEPAEVVAILSCFVFQERNASEPRLTPRLEKGKEIVLTYARKIAEIQVDCGLPISTQDYVNGLKFGLMEVVYEWARGLPFKHITDLTDVLEGSIVRCISRLDETCREVMGAARMVGDTNLYKKMEQAEQDIKRDIVFAASLYF